MRDARMTALARALRRRPAATEALLWRLLRDRRLEGLKFRRQVPVGRYVADFACKSERLIVEADGPWHDCERDAARDADLAALGWRVLRFSNAEVCDPRARVLDRILAAAVPSPAGREKVAPRRGVG